MSVIIFILILALLVLVHEFGHFIAAKKAGVLVEEFGIGFPPRIFGVKIGETLYSLNIIFLGGFVKLYGEEYKETANKKEEHLTKRAFSHKKPFAKAFIVVCGVIGNFLLGWILVSYLFTQGVPTPTNHVVVESVQKNTPAQAAGLQESDVILELKTDNKTYRLTSANALINLTKQLEGQNINLVVLRDNKELVINLTPRKNPPAGQGPLGVVITSYMTKKYTWYQAPISGLIESFSITRQIVTQLVQTVLQFVTLKKTNVDVTGPIGIAQYTGQAIKLGKDAVLELIALLSLNLAVINILPFPALDGGKLVFVVYEWITKKRVNQTIENYTNLVGIVILLTLAILVSIHDIMKIYK